MSKGQVTSEYLLIVMISITLLFVSIGASFKIKDDADKSYQLLLFRNAANTIYNTEEEICVLGNGNSRKINVPVNMSILTDENSGLVIFILNYPDSNGRIVKDFKCELYDDYELGSGDLVLSNKNGKIDIKKP